MSSGKFRRPLAKPTASTIGVLHSETAQNCHGCFIVKALWYKTKANTTVGNTEGYERATTTRKIQSGKRTLRVVGHVCACAVCTWYTALWAAGLFPDKLKFPNSILPAAWVDAAISYLRAFALCPLPVSYRYDLLLDVFSSMGQLFVMAVGQAIHTECSIPYSTYCQCVSLHIVFIR